jgi:nucleotide-binding universal stress UspA family protein
MWPERSCHVRSQQREYIEEATMKKVLIAIDDSKDALKAADYAGQYFAGSNDLKLTLVHVLPNLPAIFWDEGHILSEDEKNDRKKVVDKWLADRKAKMEPVFQKAIEALTGKGIKPQQIQTKSISDSTDVAESILEEAKDGGYQTIIMGRRGRAEGKHSIIGDVTSKIVNQGSGMAITVVE